MASEGYGAGKIIAGWEEHLASSCAAARIDSAIDCWGVQGNSITKSAKIADIEGSPLVPGRRWTVELARTTRGKVEQEQEDNRGLGFEILYLRHGCRKVAV